MTQRGWRGRGWIALALAGTLAGCASDADKAGIDASATRAAAHAQMPGRLNSVNEAPVMCEPLRSQGDRPWSAAAECYNRRLASAFAAGDAPYKTALFVNNAQRLQISDRVDRGAITPDQARDELDRADRTLAMAIRKEGKPAELKTLQKEKSQALATQAELLQRQADGETLLQAFERITPRP